MSLEKQIKQVKKRLSRLAAIRKKEQELTAEFFNKLYDDVDKDYERMNRVIQTAQYELAMKRFLDEVETDFYGEEEEDLDM